MKKSFLFLVTLLAIWGTFNSCKSSIKNEHSTITVSISPIKYIVDRITAGQFEINILVPPGSSPENYELTPRQLVDIEKSPVVFVTGLMDFEQSLATKIEHNTRTSFVDLSVGIDLKEGHVHSNRHYHGHSHSHHHGVDPHIWTSLNCLRTMSTTVAETFLTLYPDSIHYRVNYEGLMADIDKTDKKIKELFDSSNVKSFIIYHPALTYYADDYGITQISLEEDGKEPSAESIKNIVDNGRQQGNTIILYQKEFSRTTVETVAKDLEATPVEIDPLAENILENLLEITRIITRNTI